VTDLLADVVRATASAPDSTTVLDRAARLLTRRADWVIADRLDDPDLITRVAAYDGSGPVALPDGMGSASSRRSSAGSVGLLPVVVGAAASYLHLGPADLKALAASPEPHRAQQAAMALALGAREVLLLALVARDVVVGVLTLGRRSSFSEGEVTELTDVALHLALALDAARLLAVQRAVATAMQTSLLPPVPPVPAVPGLRLAARYTPAEQGLDVGGDWYDAFATSAGLVVVVGDVSGHDVSAAARMAALRHVLRAHAVDRDEPPSAVVARLERTADRLGLEATGTCVLGRLHPLGDAWQLTWTNAGHLPPVLIRAGEAWLLETPPDLMLGVDSAAVRREHVQVLHPGDLLLLYTDGLVEVRGTSLDQRLELLRRTAVEHAGAHPDSFADALLVALAAGGGDDVALLVIEVVARRSMAEPLGSNLGALHP